MADQVAVVRFRIILILLVAFAFCERAVAQALVADISRYAFLFSCTDQNAKLFAKNNKFTDDELLSSLRCSCSSARKLIEDGEFKRLIELYQYKLNANPAEIETIFNNFDNFLDFISIERNILIAHGISEESADIISSEVLRLRRRVVPGPVNYEQFMSDLQRGTSAICKASDQLDSRLSREDREKALYRGLLTNGGLAVVIGNGVGAAFGLGVGGIAASAAVGGAMITAGSLQ